MDGNDPYQQSLGEIARRLDEVFKRYEQIANELPKTFITKEIFDAKQELTQTKIDTAMMQHQMLQKQVEDLEDDKKWLYRLIIGAVILAVIGLLFSASHSFGGTPKPSSSHTAVSTQ